MEVTTGGEPRRDLPERTFRFAMRIVKLCQLLDDRPGVLRLLGKQIVRSGTSVGANVEEGQASQSEADFLSKYSIACKEARETLYWLRLLEASEVLPEANLRNLLTRA